MRNQGQEQDHGRVCGSCNGDGGKTETTQEQIDGRTVTRQTWHTCGSCRGSGSAR